MNAVFQEAFYAIDENDYEENIWKKHPKETSESYDYFIRYYVSNDKVIEAYRLFLFDKGLLDEEDFPNIKKISHKYVRIQEGKDTKGIPIEGLHNFEERKKAFSLTGIKPPPRIIESSVDDLKNMRVSIVKQELLDADILLQQWLLQMATFQKHVNEQKEDGTKANNQNSSILNNLIKARKEISFLFRRGVDMSDKAIPEVVEEATKEEIEIIYKEKEINTEQFEPIDYASTESFDDIINDPNFKEIVQRLGNGED